MASQHLRSNQPELIRSVSYPRRIHGTTPPRPVSLISRSRHSLGMYLVLAFVIGMSGFWFLVPNSHSNPQILGASAQENKPVAHAEPLPPPQLDYTTMNTQIASTIAQYPSMDIGVSWVDIKTGESRTIGVDKPFVAASTAKLLTAIAYLHDVENGSNTLTQQVGNRTAKQALEAMIVESDNAAWNDFNNSVMSHEELAVYANTIGFIDYDPDTNTVTPTSLAKLLGNLYQKRLLNEQHTNLLLSYMQRAKEVEFITSIAPAGVKVYHKPGYLNDRIHDAAIIDNGDRPYVLVVFTKSRTNVYNATAGADVFQSTARATFDTFLR